MTTESKDVCVCGHPKEAHQHFRSGTDCALDPPGHCDRYRQAAGVRGLLRRLLGR